MFRTLLLLLSIVSANLLFSQDITGKIFNEKGLPLSAVQVFNRTNDANCLSDANGIFKLANSSQVVDLVFVKDGFEHSEYSGSISDLTNEGLKITMKTNALTTTELSSNTQEDGDDSDSQDGDLYSLLSSSRDPMIQVAAFQWSNFRFKLRGLDYRWNNLSFNGFVMNDLELGGTPFYLFSGQNQLLRFSQSSLGVGDHSDVYNSIGLNQNYNVDASIFREGLTFNYSNSNRVYTNRVGLHYAKKFKSNLSLIAGASRRWAQKGVIPGNFYDANGFYLAVTKEFNPKFKLRFTGEYAPVIRAKRSAATKEVYELANDNLYNSYWGYQLGDVRNSRSNTTKIPVFSLNSDYQIKENIKLESGILFLKGKRSDRSLDWANASDPRPDYYQKLPSYILNQDIADLVRKSWTTDDNISQLDWEKFYYNNYANIRTILNANGISGNDVTGKKSEYILVDRHADPQELEHYSTLHFVVKKWKANINYRMEFAQKENYQSLSDLLGGDFFLDQLDFVEDLSQAHPDADKINKLVFKGDRLGYNYISKQTKYSLSTQWFRPTKKFDLLLGSSLSVVNNQREGLWRNFRFANSLGNSAKITSIGYDAKAALTYKINGRNYIQSVNSVQNAAPAFEQIFINPEWSNSVLDPVKNANVLNTTLHYYYRSPELRIKIGGYFIQLKDMTINKSFFLDNGAEDEANTELTDGGLVNAFYTNWDQQNMGIEATVDVSIGKGFSSVIALNAGDYKNLNRPKLNIYDQFSTASAEQIIYLKNYYIPSTPQLAAYVGLKYELKRNGFLTLSLSHLSQNYVEPSPLRRTSVAVQGVERNSALFHKIIDQEKLDNALSLDFFGFKSIYIFKKYCAFSLGVNNILNNKNLISGGFEQNRFDFTEKKVDQFPSKYFYLQGINYFLNLNIGL